MRKEWGLFDEIFLYLFVFLFYLLDYSTRFYNWLVRTFTRKKTVRGKGVSIRIP